MSMSDITWQDMLDYLITVESMGYGDEPSREEAINTSMNRVLKQILAKLRDRDLGRFSGGDAAHAYASMPQMPGKCISAEPE